MTGGSGSDLFVFDLGDGRDVVTDFQDGIDHIRIRSGAQSFADLTVAQSGADTVITFSDVSITLSDFDRAQITASDILFS